MSANLSHAAQGFVNCVVVGKDIVPRLSVVNIGRLVDELVSRNKHCSLAVCCQQWHVDELMSYSRHVASFKAW